MRKYSIGVSALVLSAVLIAAPIVSAYAAGGDTPTPPVTDSKGKKKGDKSSSIDDPKFLAGYRTAYTTIYDHHDYTTAIDQFESAWDRTTAPTSPT